MGDLLRSLVRESKKWTILCHWGESLQMVSELLPSVRWGDVHKLLRVASGHLLGCQEWGDPMKVDSWEAGSQEGGYCDVPHQLGMGMWHPSKCPLATLKSLCTLSPS
jgi:hypothetical protein